MKNSNYLTSCVDVDLSRVTFARQDWRATLSQVPNDATDVFLYLDPPYMKQEGLYAELLPAADHVALRDALKEKTEAGFKSWMLSHSNLPEFRSLYEDWCDITPVYMTYSGAKRGEHMELLVRPKY